MKTRIISGAVLVAVTAAILYLQTLFAPILPFVLGILCAIAVYEILNNTGFNKNKIYVSAGMILSVIVPFSFNGYIKLPLEIIYVVYTVFILAVTLRFHKSVASTAAAAAIVYPIILSYAFSCLCSLTQYKNSGLFFIFVIFCWSSVADTGAYFTGVIMGRHKMAPVISPKKTWEGLAGGIVLGFLATLLVCFIYDKKIGYNINYSMVLYATPFFILAGVLGDLSTSIIKRDCEIKDFGNLIPGHGGILDRFDSILMIAPIFYQLVRLVYKV